MSELVFVTGASRSGTTLMAEILGTSAKAATLPELHFFENLVDENSLDQELTEEEKKSIIDTVVGRALMGLFEYQNQTKPRLGSDRFELSARVQKAAQHTVDPIELYSILLSSLSEWFGVRFCVDHTGKNIFFLKFFVKKNIPIKVVHMIRDPRSALVSQANRWKVRFLGEKGIPISESIRAFLNFNPIFESLVIRSVERSMTELGSCDQLLVVKYEDLIAKSKYFENILNNFFRVDDLCSSRVKVWGSSFARSEGSPEYGIIENSRKQKKNNGFQGESIDFWVNILLFEYIKKYDFEKKNLSLKSCLYGLVWIGITPLQLIFIFLLNAKRFPNFVAAVRRRVRF